MPPGFGASKKVRGGIGFRFPGRRGGGATYALPRANFQKKRVSVQGETGPVKRPDEDGEAKGGGRGVVLLSIRNTEGTI